MKKLVAAACGGVLAVTTLSACGGDDEMSAKDFCSKMEDMGGAGGDMSDMQDQMEDLADKAPSDIKDDFKAYIDGMEGVDSQQEMGQAMHDPEMSGHLKKITDWLMKNCDMSQ